MAIDAATVRKVAKLARISEAEERLEPLAAELSGIMTWIEQLAEVDTDGVEPMANSSRLSLPSITAPSRHSWLVTVDS